MGCLVEKHHREYRRRRRFGGGIFSLHVAHFEYVDVNSGVFLKTKYQNFRCEFLNPFEVIWCVGFDQSQGAVYLTLNSLPLVSTLKKNCNFQSLNLSFLR